MTEPTRCPWCTTDPIYQRYHDHEWGVPVVDDRTMFSFLLLETFQAGLSWITILKRKDGFARAFANFNPEVITSWTSDNVEILMKDKGIIRNRQKIEAALNNAQRFFDVKNEFGTFVDYWWQWVNYSPIQNTLHKLSDYQAKTQLSDAISKDLKKRGFKFVGSTTIYAHLQAAGLINDHTESCFRNKDVTQMGMLDIKAEIARANQ